MTIDIGIAFDVKPAGAADERDDAFEEFDSPETIEAIAQALRVCGYGARPLGGGRALLEALLSDPPELVFNMAEGIGTRSREAQVPAVCEMLSIPYTGSDPATMAAALDKPTAKRIAQSFGLTTPPFLVCETVPDAIPLRFPVIVKPAAEGSGMGIGAASRCDDTSSAQAAVERLLTDYRQPAIVEEFCPGPELTVGILGTGPSARAIGVLELVPLHQPLEEFVYSVDTKRAGFDAVKYRTVDAPEAAALALDVHRALGCRDVSRVDLRVDASGAFSFLEINPLPGLAPGWGDITLITDAAGYRYEEFIGAIVTEALERTR